MQNQPTKNQNVKPNIKPDLITYPPSQGWKAVLNHLGTYDYENNRLLSGFFPKMQTAKIKRGVTAPKPTKAKR